MNIKATYNIIHKISLIILFISGTYIAQGQTNKAMYCQFLKKITESPEFQNTFSFCNDTNIVLIDTAGNFTNCNSILVFGRTLQVTDVKPAYITVGMTGKDIVKARDRNYNALLSHVREKHGKTDIYLFWPVQNTVVEFLVTVIKGNIVMENIYNGELN